MVSDCGPFVEDATVAAGEELLFGLSFDALGLLNAEESFCQHDDNTEDNQSSNQSTTKDNERLQAGIKELLQLKDPALLSSQTLLTTSQTKDKALDRFFAWAERTHGAILDGIHAGQDAHGGRGLFASHEVTISSGVALAVLPRSLRIGQKLACQRVAGGGVLPTNTPDLTAVSLLVLSFLKDALEKRNCNSTADSAPNATYTSDRLPKEDADTCTDNWGLYAQTLPHSRHELNNAVLASTKNATDCWAKLDSLQDNYSDDYRRASENVQATGECCHQYIRQVLLSSSNKDNDNDIERSPNEDNEHQQSACGSATADNDNSSTTIPKDSALSWAIAIVLSRTHAFGLLGCRWLTPILDLANHSANPNCELEGDSQGRLLLKTLRPIAKGEEITIDYQVDEDSKLLATYGFSLEHKVGF